MGSRTSEVIRNQLSALRSASGRAVRDRLRQRPDWIAGPHHQLVRLRLPFASDLEVAVLDMPEPGANVNVTQIPTLPGTSHGHPQCEFHMVRDDEREPQRAWASLSARMTLPALPSLAVLAVLRSRFISGRRHAPLPERVGAGSQALPDPA